MKPSLRVPLFCIAFGFCSSQFEMALHAQPPKRPGQGRDEGGPGGQGNGGPGQNQPTPLLRVFDSDGDNELSPKEIAAAVEVLRKLDKDGNGRLTADELRPAGGPRGTGGPGGGPSGPGAGGPGDGGARGPGGPGGGASGGPSGAGRTGQGEGGPRGAGRPGGSEGGQGGGRGEAGFANELMQLDENKDGLLSRTELPEHMHAAFVIADGDKNGTLDQAERIILAGEFRRDRIVPGGEKIKNAPVQPGGRSK